MNNAGKPRISYQYFSEEYDKTNKTVASPDLNRILYTTARWARGKQEILSRDIREVIGRAEISGDAVAYYAIGMIAPMIALLAEELQDYCAGNKDATAVADEYIVTLRRKMREKKQGEKPRIVLPDKRIV